MGWMGGPKCFWTLLCWATVGHWCYHLWNPLFMREKGRLSTTLRWFVHMFVCEVASSFRMERRVSTRRVSTRRVSTQRVSTRRVNTRQYSSRLSYIPEELWSYQLVGHWIGLGMTSSYTHCRCGTSENWNHCLWKKVTHSILEAL